LSIFTLRENAPVSVVASIEADARFTVILNMPGLSRSLELTAIGSSTTVGFVFQNAPGFYLLDKISLTGGVIPKPATSALMIAGFGLVGSAMRRRRGIAASVSA